MLRCAEWKTKHSSKTRQTNCKLKIKNDPVHKNMQIKATLINEDSFEHLIVFCTTNLFNLKSNRFQNKLFVQNTNI